MMDGDFSHRIAQINRQQAADPSRSSIMPESPFGYSYNNPQAMYGQMGQPDMRRQQVVQQLQQQIMGQSPTTAAGGFAKLATGIGMGINNYQQQGKQFPTAPGGAAPSFATTLGNFFTGRNNGGLY
jgi:hypothetical protein